MKLSLYIQVNRWITISEPSVISNLEYGTGVMAPGRMGSGVNDYSVGHNLLQAHAMTYKLYKNSYGEQNGKNTMCTGSLCILKVVSLILR